MKFRKAIAYFILTVYSITLVHTVIPHDHHVHDYLNKDIVVFDQSSKCFSYGKSGHHYAQKKGHDDHKMPLHSISQHPDTYIVSPNTTSNLLSQLAASLVVFCNTPPTFDLTATVTNIDKQDFYHISFKIPIQFSDAVPFRAPPIA